MLNKHPIQKASRPKTMTRCTAENYVQSTLSHVLTVLSTHFLLGESLEQNAYDKLPT